MIHPGMEKFAEVAVGRMINSLPEGVLIALGADLLLRLMRRQNSGTRFAVWLIALVGVVALPFLPFTSISGSEHLTNFHPRPELVFPSFLAFAFLIVWLFLACVALTRVAAGLWQIKRFRKDCTEISPVDLGPELRSLVEESKRPVCLLVSDTVRVPAALGFIKPAVVFPAWILHEFSPADLHPILIHELAHLRRYDSWTNLFQKAARAVFFFHPAVWWIDSRLSLEREMACDDAALTAIVSPRAYAASLIDLLERSCGRRGWTMAQAAVTRAREASQRISRILNAKGSATTRVALPALGLAAGLFIACGGVALCAPRLLSFAPEAPSMTPSVQSRLVANENIGPRVSGVVSASFHPMRRAGFVRDAEVTRMISPPQRTHRSAKPKKTRRAAIPFVMTSFITSSNADRSTVPTLMVIETSAVVLGSSASDQPYGNTTGYKQGQPRTPDAHTLQFIQPDGAAFVRIWITMSGPDVIHQDSISFVI
jgi:beta-lactamase regulating signal transducer with metallopeptidase domain